MESALVKNVDAENASGYSELQVMSSAAGYYVGTSYIDPEFGFEEPGSRDSGYFKKREDAEKFLSAMKCAGDAAPLIEGVRITP